MRLPRKADKRLAEIISGNMKELGWPEELWKLGEITAAVKLVRDEGIYDPGHQKALCRIVGYILWKAKIVQ